MESSKTSTLRTSHTGLLINVLADSCPYFCVGSLNPVGLESSPATGIEFEEPFDPMKSKRLHEDKCGFQYQYQNRSQCAEEDPSESAPKQVSPSSEEDKDSQEKPKKDIVDQFHGENSHIGDRVRERRQHRFERMH